MNHILDRVNEVCKCVRDKNQELINFKQLINYTRKTFKKHDFDLVLKTKKEKDLTLDKFYVMAYYDSESDSDGETPIEVVVHHNLTGTEQFGRHQITNFLVEIYDAVVHEYRHQYQSQRRDHVEYVDHEPKPYTRYLANQDELDAYALSISVELLRTMDVQRAKRNLSRISVMSKMRTGAVYSSPTLRAYIGHFGLNGVTRRLAKKIYRYLETIDKRNIFM
jgi:hypothetical protein